MEQVEHYQEAPVDPLLGALEMLAHQLATAESASVLPLALQEFLSLCQARCGVALTRREGAAAEVVAIQHLPDGLAEACARAAWVWASPPGGTFVLLGGRNGSVPGGNALPPALVRRLKGAGIAWCAWLSLALPERTEAVLLALGEGDPPSAAERSRARLAAAVLGDLVVGACERAHLRQTMARKDRARDEFIGLASHELKSPLTVIKGYSQLLLRQAHRADGTGAISLEGLEAISHQVGRMSMLVGELLDFSRIERGTLEIQPAPMDVVALVGRAVAQRQRAQPDIRFSFSSREVELIVLADRVRLEQVLGYLLDNAAKFGQAEGVVEVRVERASLLQHAPVPVTATNNHVGVAEDVALISVRDFGPGLPDEERAHLFTPFYRGPENSLHRQLAGLGLGLYLSHYLVTRQQGRLWAEFPLTDGAAGGIFYLALPLASAPS